MTRTRAYERSFGVVVALATMLFPASPLQARQLVLHLDSARTRIFFDADATLGKFNGTARRFSGEARIPDLEELEGASGTIVVQVASFETGNGMRDGHLRADMDADEHPTITFELRAVELENVDSAVAAAGIGDPADAHLDRSAILRGDLTIHGQTREVRIPARFGLDAGSVRVVGSLPVRFTDFSMKPPSRLLGTVKVKNDLVLGFDALFVREDI